MRDYFLLHEQKKVEEVSMGALIGPGYYQLRPRSRQGRSQRQGEFDFKVRVLFDNVPQ